MRSLGSPPRARSSATSGKHTLPLTLGVRACVPGGLLPLCINTLASTRGSCLSNQKPAHCTRQLPLSRRGIQSYSAPRRLSVSDSVQGAGVHHAGPTCSCGLPLSTDFAPPFCTLCLAAPLLRRRRPHCRQRRPPEGTLTAKSPPPSRL